MARIFLGIALLLLLCGCSGGGGGSPTDSVFIPDLSNAWLDAANPQHQLFFLPQQEQVRHSTFDGNENGINSNGTQNQFSGEFTDRSIQFTIRRPGGNVTYQGMFTTPNRMELSSSAGSLVLTVTR